ncbi:MAG: glycosyltransferase [Ferruginibacter sp.]
MNLLVVDSVDFPFGGAHSAHVSLFMKGLRENNENAFFIIPYGAKREKLAANKRQYGHFDGIPYYFVKESRKIKRTIRFLDNFAAVFKTAALIRNRKKKKKVDAVIIGGIVDIIRDAPIIITCLIFRVPVFFWLVEKASLNEDYRGVPGYLNYKSQQLSEWLFPKCASGMIVISQKLREHYKRYLPDSKILINPILVSEKAYQVIDENALAVVRARIEKEYEGKRMLVYSGTFGEKDGLFYLIEAFAEVVKQYPDTVFVMTGKGYGDQIMNRLNDHIKKYNVADKIRMVGFVNADELLCYNSLANVLFVCRSNSPYANHGFPWKLGEYCMTARPIVATRVTDIGDYFTDGESLFIVEPNNPAAIAGKIKYIFENYNKALAVAAKSREVALHEFDYSRRAKEVAEFVQSNI